MSDKDLKKSFLNCYSDLQRAATAYLLNPKGSSHLVFLAHSRKILEKISRKQTKYFGSLINSLERQAPLVKEDQKIYFADKILTTGILIKNLR